MMTRVLTLSLALAVLIGSAMADTVTAMSDRALRSEIIHRVFDNAGVEDESVLRGALAYRRDGTVLILTEGGFRDSGTWRIAGGELCTRIVALRGGEEVRFLVGSRADGVYVTSHGFVLRPRDDRAVQQEG
jgi:hypothetical protein